MKKIVTILLALTMLSTVLVGCTSGGNGGSAQEPAENVSAAEPVENDNAPAAARYTETKVDLGIGYVQVYDFGDIRLHAYKTNDVLDDECFLLESGTELVALEAPGFKDNISEYTAYIASLDKPLHNVLLAYHPAGAETLGDSVHYLATAGAQAAQQAGGSVKGLTVGFVESFGDSYDGTIPEVTDILTAGAVNIGGIDFVISEGVDGFDVTIPAINVVFTHMVGQDVHNIMPSVEAMEALAAQMQSYIDADYTLILSSHYVPETTQAAQTKLAYVQKMQELAAAHDNAADFIQAVNEAFPNYSGANYLEMTAAGLYQ